MRRISIFLCLLLLPLFLSACWGDNEEPQGLRLSDDTGGPRVLFDLDERPFPRIPFPNDVATRSDPTSPTGLRLNISEIGASDAEEQVRGALNESSGFGVFSPITLSFDAPLDIENLIARHQQLTPDFSDDAVYLVNVDPNSPGYGTLELLDMGLGNFPITMERPDNYFDHDHRSDGTNLLFPTAEHHGGIPNLRDPDGDPWEFRQVLDFYERETNTLILRPVRTLEPGTKYAVVLTSALRGENGRSVQSPFRWVNHLDQTDDLLALREILPEQVPERFDRGLGNVRFAWTFTTQVATERLEAVRAGLYGHGPLAWLADEFPAEIHFMHNLKEPDADDQMTFDLDTLLQFILPVANEELGPVGTALLEEAFDAIDYVVSGTFLSPNFLGEADGIFNENLVAIDLATGTADYVASEVPFFCTVPEPKATVRPFPTIIYSHAIGSTRLELLLFAGAMAQYGFATCAIDAAGHGIDLQDFQAVIDAVAAAEGLPNLGEVLNYHRGRDLNNNGFVQSGADYFTADVLHSRDMIIQTTIDQMQFIRILRTFDGERRFPAEIDEEDPFISARRHLVANFDQTGDGTPELVGDFNGDGTVDFGGERPYVAWGTSLGGIQTSVLAAIEPTIIAAASNAGGGGLSDIAARTKIGNVRAGVVLRMMGPLLVGRQTGDVTRIEWLLPEGDSTRRLPFIDLPRLEDGSRVVFRNPRREANPLIPDDEAFGQTWVRDGVFRVGVAADALDGPLRRQALGFDASIHLVRDIMECRSRSRCGNTNCPSGGNSYCDVNNTCQPLSECIPSFDPDTLDAEERAIYDARIVDDATRFGDPLIVEIYSPDGDLLHSFDTFPQDLYDQNMLYPEGTPLAALESGWGLERQTPRFRQFVGLAQTLLEPADPSVWAPHYFTRPLEFPYETEPFQRPITNFLKVGTLGDQTVPISSSIAVARTAGILELFEPHPAYGMPENQFLIENFVYEGIFWLDRFPNYLNTLFDPDWLDEGFWRSPRDPDNPDPKPFAAPPLRATVETDTGVSALRLGYLDTRGEHTFNIPFPDQPFDISSFLTNQVGYFLATGGVELSDDLCMEDLLMRNCSFFDPDTFVNPL